MSTATKSPTVPPVQRRRTERDLARALYLRPRDIAEIYGISESMLCDLSNHADPARRPPSRLIRGRGERKGVRIFLRSEFEAWIARWDAAGNYAPAA
jgi:hypothetical protein